MLVHAIDTETPPITDAEPVPRLVSVGVAGPAGCALFPAHSRQLFELCANLLQHHVVFANAPFDVYVLSRAMPQLWPLFLQAYHEGRIHDVLTREKLIEIADGSFWSKTKYDLGYVAKKRAGIALDKNDPWRLRYGELIGLEIEQWPADAVRYAIHDPAATYAAFAAQEQYRSQLSFDVFRDAANQARKHIALYTQHPLRGLCTDPKRVDELDRKLVEDLKRLQDTCMQYGLLAWGGTKKAPKLKRSTKAAVAMIEQIVAQTGQTITRTATGKPSLKEDTLSLMHIPDGHPLDAYRRYGALDTLRTKNVIPLSRPLIRGSYQEIIATGRTSMRKPNMQNQPREGGFRECLVPRPGYRFVISDWGQAELVTLAQIQIDWFRRSKLGDALRAGIDPHAQLGASILGVPFERFDHKKIPEHKNARQAAKPVNFGFPGGLGTKRFVDFARMQYGVIFTESEAKKHKRTWLQTWPEMPLYFDVVSTWEQYDGTYRVVQPRSGRVRGRCSYTQACNSPFQGLAADAAGETLWRLFLANMDPRSALYGCGQVLFAHDENVTEAPIGREEEARAEQDRIMIDTFARWCPDVPIKVESFIADYYTKEAPKVTVAA